MKTLFSVALALLCLISQNSLGDVATETLKKSLNNGPGLNVDYKSGCAECAAINSNATKTRPKAILRSEENNQNIELTVLSESEAQKLFSEIAKNPDIPFDFPVDGCFARAMSTVVELDKKGVTAGKAFVEGNLSVNDKEYGEINWSYHVAPVVLVNKNGKNVPYIFDPSLFKTPVPYETWKQSMLTLPKNSKTSEYYTNRFAYDIRDKNNIRNDYSEEQLIDADNVNAQLTILSQTYKEQKAKYLNKKG